MDPYSHEALRLPFLNIAFRDEAAAIFGELEEVEATAEQFFATTFKRFPVLSKSRFYERLPYIYTKPHADFILLCLSIRLAMQMPTPATESMQSSLYITAKSLIASLEAANCVSLLFIQARVLVCFYEFGHAIYPAASSSLAACAKIARSVKLDVTISPRRDLEEVPEIDSAREENRRTWWAIVNLDRLVNKYEGNGADRTGL